MGARPGGSVGLGRRLLCAVGLCALIGAGAQTVPRWVCGRGADALYRGDEEALGLARAVAEQVRAGVGPEAFHTGSARFDGEWAFGTYQMAVLGLGQVVLAHPEQRAALLPAIEASAAALLRPETTDFGRAAWGTPAIPPADAAGANGRGHGYLGYLNLSLSMLRLLDPGTRHAALHDRLSAALAARLGAAPYGVFETYPGESYPVDMAMVAGSLALYDQATGGDHGAVLRAFVQRFTAHCRDPQSGLAYQALDAATGAPTGPPRASGTALAAYGLSFVDRDLSLALFQALRRHQRATLAGFSALREYGPGHDGSGDIDSGPVVLGLSVSGTGFALAGARLHGDPDLFRELLRTAALFGVPVWRGPGRWRYLSGGPLGNAILLAMVTATWERPAGPARKPQGARPQPQVAGPLGRVGEGP